MTKQITPTIHWVGKVDWPLTHFHGHELSTHHGSSYNAYLIQEENTVLIDTVWQPFAKEFVDNLASEMDLKRIDYIIANHGEVDHSGALPELMRHIPDVPIYCTANAVKSLTGQYHQEWDFHVVKTGDTLDVGNGKQLVFIEMPMLHWPDSMATYLTVDNVLFSNDVFGQHFASEFLFNDQVNQHELYHEAITYYANILTPMSPLILKKIDEIKALNVPIDMICPSHGIIWRENPLQIVEKYTEWASAYQEDQVTIIFDTMWNGTRKMAEMIAEVINGKQPDTVVKLVYIPTTEISDIMLEVFKSKTVLIGSPTVNRGILSPVAAVLSEMKNLKFQNKKAAAFGCYGWSGEAVKIISDQLTAIGFELINDGLRLPWTPDASQKNEIAACLNRV